MTTTTIDDKLNERADSELKKEIDAHMGELWRILERLKNNNNHAGYYDTDKQTGVWIGESWRALKENFFKAVQPVYREDYKNKFLSEVARLKEQLAELGE